MSKNIKAGIYLDSFNEDEEFENKLVSAKELGDYCGLSISTISRLATGVLKRHEVISGEKKLYKLGKSVVSLILCDSLTDTETKKFNEQSDRRMRLNMEFEIYSKYGICEEDAISKYELQPSQIQEAIHNGIGFIREGGKRIFIEWDIAELSDNLRYATQFIDE